MNTAQEIFIEDWWEDVEEGDFELLSVIFTDHGMDLIEEIILQEADLVDTVELDNDFGEAYWNGSRMVTKPGFEDY